MHRNRKMCDHKINWTQSCEWDSNESHDFLPFYKLAILFYCLFGMKSFHSQKDQKYSKSTDITFNIRILAESIVWIERIFTNEWLSYQIAPKSISHLNDHFSHHTQKEIALFGIECEKCVTLFHNVKFRFHLNRYFHWMAKIPINNAKGR